MSTSTIAAAAGDTATEAPPEPEANQRPPGTPGDAIQDKSDSEPASRAEVKIPRDPSGNFLTSGRINNSEVRLLIDTGASTVIIPAELASRIGLQQGRSLIFKTGAGPVTHYLTQLDSLTIGPIQIRNVTAAINPSMKEDFALLGMSALELLHWSQQNGQLTLSYENTAPPSGGSQETAPAVKFKKSLKDCMGSARSIDQKTLDCLNGKVPP